MRRKPCPTRPARSAASRCSKRTRAGSSPKPSAAIRARASSGDKRQRLREAAGAGGVEGAGDRDDRLRGLAAGIGDDERHPGVAARAEPRVEGDAAEQLDAELLREPLAATGAEDVRGHVLDHAREPPPDLL